MKKLPFIIGIPAVAVALVLGGAMLWKLKNQTVSTITDTKSRALPSSVSRAGGSKPTNPFSLLFGSKEEGPTPIPTPTPASAAAMNADINTVGDDGGDADFSALQKDTIGL